MKIEDINGKKTITLKNNEKIQVRTNQDLYQLKNNNDKLEVIDIIALEQERKKQQYLKDCNYWLQQFQNIYEIAKQITTYEYGKNEKLSLLISFSNNDYYQIKADIIQVLDLKGNYSIYNKGITFTGDENTFNYLFINIFDYLLNKEFKNKFIGQNANLYPLNYNGIPPINIDLNNLKQNSKQYIILKNIIQANKGYYLDIESILKEVIRDLNIEDQDLLNLESALAFDEHKKMLLAFHEMKKEQKLLSLK